MPKAFLERIFRILVIVLGLWLVFDLIAHIVTEIFWFEEVGYLITLLKRWQWQFLLWFFACGVSSLFLLGNLLIASRWAWRWLPKDKNGGIDRAYVPESRISLAQKPSIQRIKPTYQRFLADSPPHSPPLLSIRLPLLFILVLIASLTIALLIIDYSQVAFNTLNPDYNLETITPALPSPLNITSLPEKLVSLWQSQYVWQLIVAAIIVVLLILKTQFWLNAIASLLSIIFGIVLSGNWAVFLQYLNPTSFNYLDPQFGKDISFYIFYLPLWSLLEFWLIGLFSYALIACFIFYLLSGNSLSEGKFLGFSRQQSRHLSVLIALVMFGFALRHWLNRYDLLQSQRGVTYGASFTDVNIQIPLETLLVVLAFSLGTWLLAQALIDYLPRLTRLIKFKKRYVSLWLFLGYLLVLIVGNLIINAGQGLLVQPNELAKEKPFIERSITLTRKAFGLEEIDDQIFNPQDQLTNTEIQENDRTIDNIRLWDTRPILKTNRQLQQIRSYYKFPDADIDRYLLGEKNLDKQQVIIAARELDYSSVPQRAQTWVNEHLIYTHGYGFTLSPVNRADESGLPYYFVKNIGTDIQEEGTLTVSSQLIRQSIPIGKPRIYYGELTDAYIMTSTKVQEFDFPSGEENVYNTYDGSGGIKISNYLSRLLFAEYLKDWQMLFTQNFTPETKLLFRRNINRRVRTIAPFLRSDRDPYLVAVDTSSNQEEKDNNYLYWIIDAYTTSDRYPYSDPGDNKFNYIRNSVKIVIDAYNGSVDFYIFEPKDPIVQTWNKIFPELFKSIEEMPVSLRRHVRYPEDLFSTQSERLLTYHMTDSQVFYNREDLWQIPEEIYGTEFQPVKPYYLIIKLPTATAEEFILLLPYTPISRPNLIGWLAARSDGENYGKLLLYKFPKQKLIYGPNQIEALINQDPVISQQISLWNREGSRAIQGNLLIIPIEQSLLYVEPLYIEAEENSLPTLARVIVVYENRIVMAANLDEALDAIFDEQEDFDFTIIRPLEQLTPILPE